MIEQKREDGRNTSRLIGGNQIGWLTWTSLMPISLSSYHILSLSPCLLSPYPFFFPFTLLLFHASFYDNNNNTYFLTWTVMEWCRSPDSPCPIKALPRTSSSSSSFFFLFWFRIGNCGCQSGIYSIMLGVKIQIIHVWTITLIQSLNFNIKKKITTLFSFLLLLFCIASSHFTLIYIRKKHLCQ